MENIYRKIKELNNLISIELSNKNIYTESRDIIDNYYFTNYKILFEISRTYDNIDDKFIITEFMKDKLIKYKTKEKLMVNMMINGDSLFNKKNIYNPLITYKIDENKIDENKIVENKIDEINEDNIIEDNIIENNKNEKKIIKLTKKHKLKNGEIKEYVYDQKKYNDKFYNKTEDQSNLKITCECGKVIFKNNKYNHIKTTKHLLYISNKQSQ